jgi:hypothetical protein
MTLPDTPFVCKNIDVEAAIPVAKLLIEEIEKHARPRNLRRSLEAIIAAALGEVIPAEVESYWVFPGTQRYVTKFQPVVSDKE